MDGDRVSGWKGVLTDGWTFLNFLTILISTGIRRIEQAVLSALIAEERRGEGKAFWGGARYIETKDSSHTEMKVTSSEGLAGFCL